jgi:hypothetical protein
MTSLPDWLVERAALDEVPAASRERIDRADARELAERIAALREDNARELAAHPAGPALAQIEARVVAARQKRARQRRIALVGFASTAATVVVVAWFATRPATQEHVFHPPVVDAGDGVRIKGDPLLVYRQVGEDAERLSADAIVRAGDLIQLQYTPADTHGVIASVDGAGVVTLHYPNREDAAPEATILNDKPTRLAHAYELDDAPRFERFFFITAKRPIDVQQTLDALRSLARRSDSDTGPAELPAGLAQWSLRLKKASPSPSPRGPQ